MKKLIIIPLIFITLTISAQKYQWNSNEKNEFIKECKESTAELFSSSEINTLCNCALGKIQNVFANKAAADEDDESGGLKGLKAVYPCFPKGWPNTVKESFMEECMQDPPPNADAKKFCECFIDNLTSKFSIIFRD